MQKKSDFTHKRKDWFDSTYTWKQMLSVIVTYLVLKQRFCTQIYQGWFSNQICWEIDQNEVFVFLAKKIIPFDLEGDHVDKIPLL